SVRASGRESVGEDPIRPVAAQLLASRGGGDRRAQYDDVMETSLTGPVYSTRRGDAGERAAWRHRSTPARAGRGSRLVSDGAPHISSRRVKVGVAMTDHDAHPPTPPAAGPDDSEAPGAGPGIAQETPTADP